MSILPLTPPQRGFESAELEQRTVELQQRLRAQNIDAAFLRPNLNFAISVALNRSSGKAQLDLGFGGTCGRQAYRCCARDWCRWFRRYMD